MKILKKNTCIFLWLGAVVLSVALRTVEMLEITEYDTGFIKSSYKWVAVVLTVIIGLAIAFSSVFVFKSTREGVSKKGFNSVTSLSAFVLGIALAVGTFSDNYIGVPQILKLLCIAFSLISAVYFVFFAARSWVSFPFSPILSVIPAVFFVLKSAAVAIKGAYHTVISDSVFEIAAYCFVMLFFLEFARQVNGSKQSGSTGRLAAFGMAASILSLTTAVPKMIVSAYNPSALHDSSKGEYIFLFVGLYIACEIFSRLCFVQEKSEGLSLCYAGKH